MLNAVRGNPAADVAACHLGLSCKTGKIMSVVPNLLLGLARVALYPLCPAGRRRIRIGWRGSSFLAPRSKEPRRQRGATAMPVAGKDTDIGTDSAGREL